MNQEPIKILLVDDVPENLVALEALLRRSGVELVIARSGAEALEHCLTHELSLALVDVQMPEMDGFELAELMRGAERSKHVPIIFVTAGARDRSRTFRGYESGAVDVLYKPIDPQILTSKVNVFLELARQRRQLAHALQVNEMFVAILGHDLRNPLAAITTGIDLVGARPQSAPDPAILERMRRSCRRMDAMIRDLLDLSHARLAGGLGLARSRDRFDLHDVLTAAVDEMRAGHDRELVLSGTGMLPVVGDRERMSQLFSNLIANAVVHGRKGTPVTVRASRDPGGAALVDVHNLGVVPDEVRASLFEPFRRARNTTAEGLGLGLYIAREIVVAHGGSLTIDSNTKPGATFVIRLPLAAS